MYCHNNASLHTAWNMPYYSSSTERPQSILRLDSNSSSLSPELRLISIAFSNYFGHLSSILSTRKERSEISTSSLVIYYHDFTTLLRAYPSRQKEIISLLAQALHNHHDVLIERHGAVIVIPSTPTYSSLHVETPGGVDGGPESGIHDHGSGRISSLLKNLFSPPSSSSSSPPSAPEEDGGSEEDHKNNNIDNQEFDFASILDSFIGIPSIKLLPPIAYTSSSSSSSSQSRQLSTHSATARTTTHSPSLLDEFKKAIEHDGKMQILATNLVEVRFAAARAGVSIKENGKEETCSSSLVSTGWDWLVQPKDLARSNDSLIFPSSSSTMTSYPHPTTTLPTSIQSRFSITLLKRIQEVGLRSAVLSDHFLTPSEADMIIRMAMGGGQSLFNASIDKDAAALVKNNEIAGSSVRVLMADSFSKVSYKDPSPVLPSPLLPPSLSSRKNSPENVTNTSPAITTTNSTAIKSKSSKPESSPITASSMNNSSTTFIQLQDLVKALETFAAVSDAENIAAAGIEYASVFKSNPRDILSLNQYEQRLLKQCLVRPSSTKSAITTTKTNNTTSSYESSFDKIGGLAKTKSLINELIRLPLHAPQLFSHGILSQSTTGILLFGPPGTGKTLLARAVATDANANFLNVQVNI